MASSHGLTHHPFFMCPCVHRRCRMPARSCKRWVFVFLFSGGMAGPWMVTIEKKHGDGRGDVANDIVWPCFTQINYYLVVSSVQLVVLIVQNSDDVHTQVSLVIKGKRRQQIQWLWASKGASGIHIPDIFPIQSGAKALLGVSQTSNRFMIIMIFIINSHNR